MRGIIGAGALLVTVLAAAGCGGADQPASPSGAPPEPGVGAPPTADAVGLPGVREFGLTDEQFVDHVERVQSLIADCMDRAGFEYVPVDVATIERAQASVRKEPGVPNRQYKERWGLSVTTRFDDPVHTIGLGPNVQIMENLSEADLIAYELTLFGEDSEADFAWTLDEEDFSSTGGCTRDAVAQVFTPEQLEGAYVNPKDILVEEDSRIVAALDAWTQCMHDKGYNYEKDQDAIIEDYEQRLDVLLEGDDPEILTGARLDALHALQQQEIQVALADFDCQEIHTVEVFRQVEIEIFGRPVSG